MPTTIGIETPFDFLLSSDAGVENDPVGVDVIMVADVAVVVVATGGKSVGSRTVYLMNRDIIKIISCHREENSRT